ncbi:MAG: TetR/AcrR family transcriptional regulator [Chloroflexota bacterium]
MTRDEILEAAAGIIREKGFHATSMQDIAAAVDLRKASLYHHVSSKQEILVDLLDKALDLLILNMQAVVEPDIPADEKLRQAIRSYLNILTENPGLTSVLLLEHRSLEDEYRQRHVPRRDAYEKFWTEILQQGVDQGLFDCREPKMAVKAILGIANWTIMWFNPDGRLSSDQISDVSADLILNGLFKRGNGI